MANVSVAKRTLTSPRANSNSTIYTLLVSTASWKE